MGFLGRGPQVGGKRRDTCAHVHGYNSISHTRCTVVFDTVVHVSAGVRNTDAHEMHACLTDSCTLMHSCFSESCA
jgi:hypothetical protein